MKRMLTIFMGSKNNDLMYKIIAAEKSDLPEILELQKKTYRVNGERYNNLSIQPLIQTLADLEKEYDQSVVLKAVSDGVIIGSIRGRYEQGTLHIAKLMVDSAFQNRGVGSALVKEMENIFFDTERVELFTGERDEKNIALYKKLGFKIFAEKEHETITFVYMEKIRTFAD